MSFAGTLLLRAILGTNADTEFEADRDLVGGAVANSGPRRSTP
jgi:hypothetical protein